MLNVFSAEIAAAPVSHIFMLLSYQYLEKPFKEINIYGSLDSPKVKKLLSFLRNNYKPELLLKISTSTKKNERSEFSLCSSFVCGERTDNLDDILSKL